MAELNEATADVAETVAETAMDFADEARSLSPRELRFLLLGIGGGVVGGFIIGGLVCRKVLEVKYAKLAETEIDEMREYYTTRARLVEEKPPLEELVTDLGYSGPNVPNVEEAKDEILTADRVKRIEEVEDVEAEEVELDAEEARLREEEAIAEAVIAEKKKPADEGWDYEVEVASRDPEKPYIIHVDERQEFGYPETTLVYYEGDDVLCDEMDKPLSDIDSIVGSDNLGKFGHGAPDQDIVYIRNDRLAIQVEVVKNEDSYAETVHGEVKHSATRQTLRRRRVHFDDE